MPIDINLHHFKKQETGFRWDKKNKIAYFDIRDVEGRRYRELLAFPSVEDAKSAFAKLRSSLKTSKQPAAPAKTFGEFYTEHWKDLRGKTKDRTFNQDTKHVEAHLLPFFGNDVISDLGEVRIEAYVAHAKDRKIGAATINYSLRMLRKLMHGMRKRKMLADVPSMPFEKEPTLRNEFTEEEQAAYLGAFDDLSAFHAYLDATRVLGPQKASSRFQSARRFGGSLKPQSEAASVYFSRFRDAKTWFLTALHTGLRRGDVTNLKWSAINFTEGFIRVTMQKTGREATIPLSSTLRAALLERRSRQVVSEYVIINAEGHRYGDSIINRYHRIAKSIAGITRRVRIHDLRHSFGARLASAGASELMLKDFFGHESTKMVQRYSRPSSTAMKLIAAALDGTGPGPVGHQIGHPAPAKVEQLVRKQQPENEEALDFSRASDRLSTGAVDRT